MSLRSIILFVTVCIIGSFIWIAVVSPPSYSSSSSSSSISSSPSPTEIVKSSPLSPLTQFKSCTDQKPSQYKFTKPLTYPERYRECLELKRTKSDDQLISFFKSKYADMMRSTSSTTAKYKEMVLVRISKRKWTLDFWLNTCSLLLEGPRQEKTAKNDGCVSDYDNIFRHVFLFTLNGHQNTVPFEFRPFVRIHNEDLLSLRYTDEIYTDGYQRGGDLASADFLVGSEYFPKKQETNSSIYIQSVKNNNSNNDSAPKILRSKFYDFVWSIEHDVRYVGESWSDLFYNSRFVLGKSLPDLGAGLAFDETGNSENNQLTTDALGATDDLVEQYRQNFACYKNVKSLRKSIINLEHDLYAANIEATLSVSQIESRKIGQLPHLVSFYPPMLNDGYYNLGKKRLQDFHDKQQKIRKIPRLSPPSQTWHFSQKHYFKGTWNAMFDQSERPTLDVETEKNVEINKKIKLNAKSQRTIGSKWIGLLMPFFGMSRELAHKIVQDAKKGNSHANQEVVLPVTALIHDLKMISTHGCLPSQFYFAFGGKSETAPLYADWAMIYFSMDNTTPTMSKLGIIAENNSSISWFVTDEERNEFRNLVKNVPQIGFNLLMNDNPEFAAGERKIASASCKFYGTNTREFSGMQQIGDVIIHPVKL